MQYADGDRAQFPWLTWAQPLGLPARTQARTHAHTHARACTRARTHARTNARTHRHTPSARAWLTLPIGWACHHAAPHPAAPVVPRLTGHGVLSIICADFPPRCRAVRCSVARYAAMPDAYIFLLPATTQGTPTTLTACACAFMACVFRRPLSWRAVGAAGCGPW